MNRQIQRTFTLNRWAMILFFPSLLLSIEKFEMLNEMEEQKVKNKIREKKSLENVHVIEMMYSYSSHDFLRDTSNHTRLKREHMHESRVNSFFCKWRDFDSAICQCVRWSIQMNAYFGYRNRVSNGIWQRNSILSNILRRSIFDLISFLRTDLGAHLRTHTHIHVSVVKSLAV